MHTWQTSIDNKEPNPRAQPRDLQQKVNGKAWLPEARSLSRTIYMMRIQDIQGPDAVSMRSARDSATSALFGFGGRLRNKGRFVNAQGKTVNIPHSTATLSSRNE